MEIGSSRLPFERRNGASAHRTQRVGPLLLFRRVRIRLEVSPETPSVKIVVANCLDELVLSHNVVEADGTGTGRDVFLREELSAEINQLVDDGQPGGLLARVRQLLL
jgi:hypothetical protein